MNQIDFSIYLLRAFFLFFGGTFALVLAVSHLIQKRRGERVYLDVLLLFCLGLNLIHWSLLGANFYLKYPHLQLWNVPLIPALGPLLYFYFRQALRPDYKFRAAHLTAALPSVLMPFLLLPFYLKSAEFKLSFSMWKPSPEHAGLHLYLSALYLLIQLYLLAFLGALLKQFSFLFNIDDLKKEGVNRVALFFIVLSIVIVLTNLAGEILNSYAVYTAAFLLTTAVLVLLFLAGLRYPQFMRLLQSQAGRDRYRKTRLAGVDTDRIIERLRELMEIEKFYADEDITLPRVAEELGITTHQLSEIFNKKLNVNFNAFVNRYRVQAAKQMLLEEPDRTILSISAAVGFNSKSTFNSAFQKLTGRTPSECRNIVPASQR